MLDIDVITGSSFFGQSLVGTPTLICDSFPSVTHCCKSVPVRSWSGQYFPAFGLNTDRYGVSLRIQSKWEKIRTRITLNTDTFYAVTISTNFFSVRTFSSSTSCCFAYCFSGACSIFLWCFLCYRCCRVCTLVSIIINLFKIDKKSIQ